MNEIFIIIQCGHEGIEKLLFATTDKNEAINKVNELKSKILIAIEHKNKILDEFGREEDENCNTYYDRMCMNQEISFEEYDNATFQDPNAYCIQKWDGKEFSCVCNELNCAPDKAWLY